MTTQQLPPDLITLPEAARRLGLSENTIRRMASGSERPEWVLQLGRSYRVSVPRLERFLHGEAS
jgi:excisionase family DNA binding protein